MALKRDCRVCGEKIEVGGNGILLPHPALGSPPEKLILCAGGAQDWSGKPIDVNPLVKALRGGGGGPGWDIQESAANALEALDARRQELETELNSERQHSARMRRTIERIQDEISVNHMMCRER